MTKHSADTRLPHVPVFAGKHRLEALSDGIYAIALTLLVLEFRLPPADSIRSGTALAQALLDLFPKAITWVNSFLVMSVFWLSQQRIYQMLAALDSALVWTELMQLALISLLPFSTSVMGEHGTFRTAAVLYSGHLLLIALLSWRRTAHALAHPELLASPVTPGLARSLRIRVRVLTACTAAAFALAFLIPAWNMLAMLPTMFLPRIARLSKASEG